MTMCASPIARDYVQLALAIGQHIPGYVDAYYVRPSGRTKLKPKACAPLMSWQGKPLTSPLPSPTILRWIHSNTTFLHDKCGPCKLASAFFRGSN